MGNCETQPELFEFLRFRMSLFDFFYHHLDTIF